MNYDSGTGTRSNRASANRSAARGRPGFVTGGAGRLVRSVMGRLLSSAALVCAFAATAPVAASADVFNGYQAGNWPAPTLSDSPDCLEGNTAEYSADYTVTVSNVGAAVTVLSIHGGRIEASTSAITSALASLYGWNRYDFNAHGTARCLKGGIDTAVLHITASHFDDPRAVSLVSSSTKAVAIHGYRDSRGYQPGVICVGGADAGARSTFIAQVKHNASAWGMYALDPVDAPSAGSGACGDLPGTASMNIVNRTSSGGGLQLELTRPHGSSREVRAGQHS